MFDNTMGEFTKMRGVPRWLLLACLAAFAIQYGSSQETRVVCYYTNWSVYRPGTAKFGPQNINPYLCTHLIYAFGGFTKENTLKPFDKYQDIEKGGYAKFTGLKTYNPNLKTLLAIGGWNEGSSRFSSLVASSERRREFVKNAIKFMRQNKFDGLDLDWEYPAFRDGSKPKDKANYAKLVQELREEFEKESEATGRPRLLLTMAVPAGIEYIDKGYDVPKLNRYLDWFNILSYDYHSAFEPAVNHHSPLYPLEAASEYNYDSELNVDHSIKHYLEAGADRDKLVLGIPTYGRSYTLFNPDSTAIGAPADGPGEQGEATREKGYLAYYEICESLLPKSRTKRASDDDDDDDEDSSEDDEEWIVVQPNANAMGPYAYKGNQWVGYDDIDITKKKAEYVAEKGLGGIMFWSIDNDDFRGKCHGKPYPLIEAAKEAYYKALGVTEKIAVSKKPQTGGKRTRPKPSSSDDEEKEISRNTIKTNRNRNRITDSNSESSTTSSSRRRQNLKRTSTTTTASPSAATPDWGVNTPEPPTTPDPGTDFKCEEEGFWPHPRDCKKYFWCLDSGPSNLGIVAHQFTCPSGLYFNKAADSCDFARNVLCNKKKATTKAPPVTKSPTTSTSTSTTTSAPRTTTAQTRISPQLANLFTTRRPLPKITAATSKTTLLSRPTITTPIPQEEYEDEETIEDEIVPDSEEDPKVIKELIDLIKKLGGIEQLEKYLAATSNNQGSRNTTPPTVSRLLYERVLSQTRAQGERAPPQINSRGPQAAGLEKYKDSDLKSSRWEKPQYTTINRQRPSTTTTEETEVYAKKPEDVEEDVYDSPSSTVRSNLPQYVNIRRGRPSSTTEVSESTVRNALYDRGSSENDSDVDDVKNGVQGFEYSNIRRFRPTQETQENTTPRYQTIQRARPTSTETIHEDDSQTTSPVDVTSQYISSTEKPIQTSPKYATVARFPSTPVSPQIVETTTIHTSTNDINDSNDVNVEIASPSFASENGIIKNKDSVLSTQISLLSNNLKNNDNAEVTPTSHVSYSTEVTISEEPFYTSSKGTPLFVKRTRPTTTTTEKQETTSLPTTDKKVSPNRVYSNVRRTTAHVKARISDENTVFDLGQYSVASNNDNIQGETNDNLIEYKVRSRARKIRSTTPSSQEITTDSDDVINYGSRRTTRPQIRFGVPRFNSNSLLRGEIKEPSKKDDISIERLASSGESTRAPTFRSRRLQTSSIPRNDDSRNEEDGETITLRPQPIRRFRPTLKDFGPDLSSLTAYDSSRRNSESSGTTNSRNPQINRRYRPSFAPTKPPIEDSVDSDSTPVRTFAQRTFAPRGGRFTTEKISSESDLDEEASEASVIPRGRKLSIARFTPRPFSKLANDVLEENDDADDVDAQEENDLTSEVLFESQPIGKARLTAPVITVSEDKTSTTTAVPLSSINVTKVINSNILLGQSNNRSGILLLRRLSKPTVTPLINSSLDHSIDNNDEGIHLSESNIEQEQTEENNLPVDRPRKRIIIKKTRPRVESQTENLVSAATEKVEVTTTTNKEQEKENESVEKDAKPRVRKILRRRPATSTVLSLLDETSEAYLDKKLEGNSPLEGAKTNETVPTVTRRRKIIRKKLKPVLTEEGKQRIEQTKEETVVTEEKLDTENDVEEKESTTITPTESSNNKLSVDSENKAESPIAESSTPVTVESTTFRPTRKTIEVSTATEPSSTTTAKTFNRKHFAGPFTTPTSSPERESTTDRPNIDKSPRRPVLNARPINRRPYTTPSTTTVDDDDYNSEEDEVEEKQKELVFVPIDQLFTRAPPKQVDVEDESEEDLEEKEVVERVLPTQRPINRFAPGRRPPIFANRQTPASGRESNRPVNVPQGVKPSDEGTKRFNRPIAFQPNRSNRFSTASTVPQVEATTRPFLRKFTPNKPQSDSVTTDVNIEAVSAKHKQLFSNPRRFTTIKSSLQVSESDSTTEYYNDVTTSNYDSETENYESTTTLSPDNDEWLSSENELDSNNEIDGKTEKSDLQEPTISPEYEFTTPYIENNDTVQTRVHLDKLFSVSRIVEISSKEDKHKLNSKNETRLVEEGQIKQEKKPTLDKIGEVSRFTLIKIVEGDIPIYLTNLSHEYPVENPPYNPIRIDEARNARALRDFVDSGKENLIASESVNAAYNHKNGVIELVQTPVELDYKTDTDDKGNKLYVVESTTLLENTEVPTTEMDFSETETYMTTDPPMTERMFVPGAIDKEILINSDVKVVTPKTLESSTIALEALFGANDTNLLTSQQQKTVVGPQPFVVYASPIVEIQTNKPVGDSNESETNRQSSGRSIESTVEVQILQNEEKSIKIEKSDEFHGVPAALDVITEKQSASTTEKSPEILSNSTTESPIPVFTVMENKVGVSNTTTSENSTHSTIANIETSTNIDDTITETTVTTVEPTEQTTVSEMSETTTPVAETIKPTVAKTLTSSLLNNTTPNKFDKNRFKIPFPRRFQSNGTLSNLTTRTPFNPLAKSSKNRTLSLDSKNIPYTTPKYNRTNSYTSGKSRFTATRTQNVPIDTRKNVEGNKFKPTTTTTAAPKTTKTINIPIEPTTSKVTIRRFKPRPSLFARRTSTTSTEPTTQDLSPTEVPSIDNNVVTERQKNPSVRPTFYPRRPSNRFSERGRSSTTTAQTTISEPSTARYTSLRRRPPSTLSRRPSTPANESTTTEFAEASTSRPNRLIVRKYYNNKQRGGGVTQNSYTDEGTTRAPEVTTRKPYRVGVRRRLPSRGTSTSSTTESVAATSQYDQESKPTVQRNRDNDADTEENTKKVKIYKRPFSNVNELIQNGGSKSSSEEETVGENKEKKYSSVIKEDNTVVQQEVTRTPVEVKDRLIGSVDNVVTPDVALAAHHLLSAPLPTSPSYDHEDKSGFTTQAQEEKTFTRAYLLASISPPIVNNDYITDYVSTTETPTTANAFIYPTRNRKISTTVRPKIVYASTFSQPVVRRRPQTPAAFEKIAPVTNHYRTVVDYEYYDDDDIRFVGNKAQQEKVIVRGTGVIQCLDQGNFPHPKSCKKFISCAKMETGGVYGWEYTCPKGLSFDPVGGICNWSAGLGCNEH